LTGNREFDFDALDCDVGVADDAFGRHDERIGLRLALPCPLHRNNKSIAAMSICEILPIDHFAINRLKSVARVP